MLVVRDEFVISFISTHHEGLEVYRLHLYRTDHRIIQKIAGKNYTAVPLSIFSQAPAFFFIGTGEVLAAITGIEKLNLIVISLAGIEFAYSQSPPTMKSILMATFYTTQALGYYLGMGFSGPDHFLSPSSLLSCQRS